MAARITNILPFLLITLLCVGVVEGGYQALEHFALKTPVENEKASDTVVAVEEQTAELEQKKDNDYKVILKRNLFGPPPGEGDSVVDETPDVVEELESTSLNIVLMGTINGEDGAGRAIILDNSSRKQELYEVGDSIQGASIKEILRGKVILVYNGKDEMLDMSEASKVRSSYAVPVTKLGGSKKQPGISTGAGTGQYRRPTPRRVINRPRAIRPSRVIRKE
ncbi:MAG: type II secretion system protein N [Desulforhopalus sp.]